MFGDSRPQWYPPVITGTITAWAYYNVMAQNWPDFMSLAVWVGAAFTFFLGGVWGLDHAVEWANKWHKAHINSTLTLLADLISRMGKDQIEMFLYLSPVVHTLDGEPIAIQRVDLGGYRIPLQFVFQFINSSDEKDLEHIGNYSDSKARKWADTLTDCFVAWGWAREAAGNQSAKWVGDGKSEALNWAKSQVQSTAALGGNGF